MCVGWRRDKNKMKRRGVEMSNGFVSSERLSDVVDFQRIMGRFK